MRPSVDQVSFWLKQLGKTTRTFRSIDLKKGPLPLDGDCIVVSGENKNDRPTLYVVVNSIADRKVIEKGLERESVHTVDRWHEPDHAIVKVGVASYMGRYKAHD